MIRRRAVSFLLCVFALAALPSAPARAAQFECNVAPWAGEKFKSAQWRIWIPDELGAEPVRGLIVRQHGCGRKGLDHADDLQWQALAAKHRCALVGSHLQPHGECGDWCDPQNGSERAFLAALRDFAKQSSRPEIEHAPWALWGHSGGAGWAFKMTIAHPSRVAAVMCRSMGLRSDPGLIERTDFVALGGVPYLGNTGAREEHDPKFAACWRDTHAGFHALRGVGAPALVAVDPLSNHDTRRSRELALPFFDAMLAARLPARPGDPLRVVDATTGWLGDPVTFEVAPAKKFSGDRARAAWLPGETFARQWQEYCRTGEVKDLTPPPAPYAVTITREGGAARLTWRATADLESGVKAFHVYRDGTRLHTIAGEVTKANPRGAYQYANYGDEPEPRLPPALALTDAAAPAGARYEITAVNQAGLESPRSAPVFFPP